MIIAILPLNILSILVCRSALSSQLSGVHSAQTYALETTVNAIDDRLYNTNSLLYSLPSNNHEGILFFQQREGWRYTYDRQQLYTEISNLLPVSNYADTIFFYSESKEDWLIVNRDVTVGAAEKDDLESFLSEPAAAKPAWHYQELKGNPVLLRMEYDSLHHVYYGGVLFLSQYEKQFTDSSDYESLQLLFGSQEVSCADDEYIYHTFSQRSDLILQSVLKKSEARGMTGALLKILFSVIIAYLLLIPFLLLFFIRGVVQPLRTLNHAHDMLKQGDEDYQISETARSSEFTQAYESFNTMGKSLKELRIENLNKEVFNHKLELEYLRLQIRPHFLLNNFSLLYTLVQNHNEAGAQELILYLSEYFRYLFKKGSQLALFSSELNLIRKYLDVCRRYYNYRFTVSIQIDPVISLMRVPPLLFHSFMENIIQHAVTPDKVTHIVFCGEYEDRVVTFIISDDGRGMDAEAVDAINSISSDIYNTLENGQNVGIRNSIQRLWKYYGESAKAEVTSELNVGTTVTITIPYNLDEEADMEPEDDSAGGNQEIT